MKRWLLGIGIGIAGLLGVLGIAVGVLALLPSGTRPIRGEESIAEIRSIELGGFKQTVLLRGNDRRNPILLYLHGGPGGGQLPLARHYSQKLEKYFVVVHWDQRGAGASGKGVDWNTIELAEKLG
jgi:pimeloyl-ACP methyl ester carboxylesterase